jgi:Inner membrane protein YgaP-like, transmembrane domain
MTVERALRLMAGIVILVSMVLANFVSPKWYYLTAFVGLNLLQSAFTNWCPAMTMFRKLGMREGSCDTKVVLTSSPHAS